MKSFSIELVTVGKQASIYTIRYAGESMTEAEKFFSRFNQTHTLLLQEMDRVITNIAYRRGAQEQYFRMEEGKRTDAVTALPEYNIKSELRLYCLRLSKTTVVLYNGGIKDKDTYQEVPELDRIVKELQQINQLLDERMKPPYPEIYYRGNNLEGDLYFELDDE